MARTPFYGRGPGPAIARMDMNTATAPGRAYGQMAANLGKQVGDTIREYGLNKAKRAKLTGEIEAYYEQNKDALGEIGMSGDEAQDKKDFLQRDKFVKGDMSMAELEGYAGKLARGDVLKTQAAQNETRAIANELGRVNLGISKELQDTKIQLGKDQGTLSDINVQIQKMRERGLTKEEENMLKKLDLLGKQTDAASDNLDYKTDAEKQAALLSSATSRANIGLVDPRAEATKAQLDAVPGQVERQELLGDLQVKAAERADTSVDLLLEAFGGAEGKAEFDYQGAKLSRKNLKLGMKVLSQKGDYYDYLATAKGVPVDTKKQYASIVSDIGKLTGTLVKDPDTGNQITFTKYMELANEDPDMYPLTGANSGPAGRLYGSFITAQKQADDLLKTTQVQVDDGQGAGGSPTPAGSPINVGNMQPQQAMQALQDRIGEIRRKLPQLNAQEQQLGQPGQMTTTAFDTSPFGNTNTPLAVRPQTIGDVQNSNIPQQRLNLMAELQKLEAKRQDLQNQFGVR